MQCPKCNFEEIRVAECFEILYELNEDGTPGDIINDVDFFAGPGDYYYCCVDCWTRWDLEGHLLRGVSAEPDRIQTPT